MAESIIERPLVAFGRDVCAHLDDGLRREWLVTNGLGGYASSTLAGVNTRRYHGWLVAALAPPVRRTVFVGGAVEWATYRGRRYALSTHEFADGTIHPRGYVHLQSFVLDGTLPVWVFALGDALIERRIWMVHGANTTCLTYRLIRWTGPITLDVTPLVTYRDFHTLTRGEGRRPSVEPTAHGAVVHAGDDAVPLYLTAEHAPFVPGGDWYWNYWHREEAARGLDARADLFAPGTFHATLTPDSPFGMCLAAESRPDLDVTRALVAERARQTALLRRAGADQEEPAVQQLILAADQFLVEGRSHTPARGKTIVAGYHWFNDWGRDTMIAVPGLCLSTGRPDEAAGILRSFAPYVTGGLLPNNFADRPDADPGYNTVDAALWYALAVYAYDRATGNSVLAADLAPVLRQIVDAYAHGTRFGIVMDPADGLIRAGEPGAQLTWMDARVGERAVTPRIGKPVEVNALWYNTLRIVAMLARRGGDLEAVTYDRLSAQVKASFRKRFVPAAGGALADVVDGPDGDDWTLRPNQILAVSLPSPLLEGDEAAVVVEAVGRDLLTTYGLRSLDPRHPAYRGDYDGDQTRRDEAYHQGTAWAWLLGAYAEAHYRTHHDRLAVADLVRPIETHLRDAGLGTISEIFAGDPPHAPRGCIAQAWSVAEILRVWRTYARQAR